MNEQVASTQLLTVTGLRAGYGGADALAGVDFSLPAGGCLALLGPNGAGKSCRPHSRRRAPPHVGRDLLGRRKYHRGCQLCHRSAGTLAPARDPRDLPGLDGRGEPGLGTARAGTKQMRQEARDVINDRFPMFRTRRRQLAGTLSGGEQQMLALCHVAAVPPRILVADELSLGSRTHRARSRSMRSSTRSASRAPQSCSSSSFSIEHYRLPIRVIILRQGRSIYESDAADLDAGRVLLLHDRKWHRRERTRSMINPSKPVWCKAAILLAGAAWWERAVAARASLPRHLRHRQQPHECRTIGYHRTSVAPASCSSTAGVSANLVKVGVLWSQTGSFSASSGAFGAGARARIDEANDGGGINGRKIDEIDADNQSDPGKALAAAQGLVQSNGVLGLINGTVSGAPLFPYLNSNKIPDFSWSATDPTFGTAPNEFSISGAWGPKGATPVGAQVQYVKQSGGTRVAIVSSTSPISLSNVHNLDAGFKGVGLSIVYENDAIPFSSFDATSVALRMKQVNADVIVLPIAIAPAISIVQAIRQQALHPKLVILATAYDPAALTAGLAGVVTTDTFVPYLGAVSSLSPAAQHFREEMAKYQPKANLSFYAVAGYAAASEFLYALQRAGACPTQANIVTAMRSVSAYSAGGLLPQQVQYTPGISPDGNPQSCEYFIEVQQNSFSVPTQPTCAAAS